MNSRYTDAGLFSELSGESTKEVREANGSGPRKSPPRTAVKVELNHHSDDASLLWHELLSPVTLIKAYTSTLLQMRDAISEEEHSQYIKGIDTASDKLVRLLENLRDMTRLEHTDIACDQNISLTGLVKQVISEMQSQTSRHTLRLHFRAPLPRVRVSPEKIEQVITNLITNAIKYSPDGGAIEVDIRMARTAQECEGICPDTLHIKVPSYIISVSDTGMGIPEDDLSHIFEKFYRVNNELVRSAPGAGLGLYICRIIVESHGGRIWAANRPGGGSVFSFSLPLDIEPPESQ
jgi:two-component system, OmpR family, sensor histidine kinase KdpD